MEPRLLLDGGGLITHLAGALDGVIGPLPTVVLGPTVPSKSVTDQQMGLPMLDSKPDAPATLYLDFTGNFESDWWHFGDNGTQQHFQNITTPVFDTDGNAASFSADEKATIKEIWSRVAEDYAPFNINVTTHYYGSFNNGQALKVAIGGNNTDWLHGDASGISSIGSFSDAAPNVVFVFDLVAWARAGVQDSEGHPLNGPAAMATTISHEAGHAFGLRHHSLYNVEGDRMNEYDPGTLGWTPIMGNNKAADRTTWDAGPTDQGAGTFQDDLAILSGPANGFGFRADDHGNTTATATPLTMPMTIFQPLTGQGIINDWRNDVDFFKFTTAGGAVQVRVNAAHFGPNLIPVAELWSDHGFVSRANAGSLTESIINANVPAGTYYVLVKGFGDYGDEGQYTVAVDFGPVLTQGFATLQAPVTPPATLPAAPPAITARVVKVKGQSLVQIFDAATGALLRTLKPFGKVSGKVQAELIDVNGDGVADLVVTARVNGKLRKKVFSGLDLVPPPPAAA